MELPMANEFTGELFIHIMEEIRKAKSYIGLIELAENVAPQSDSLGTGLNPTFYLIHTLNQSSVRQTKPNQRNQSNCPKIRRINMHKWHNK